MEHRVDEFRKQAERMENAVNNAQSGNQNVTRVIVQQEPDRYREGRTALMVVAVMSALFALYIANDARNEVRTERLSREIMTRWTAQEVTAIRSYITTGKLAPMNPPPLTKEKEPNP
jgi:hypothetical protein